MEGLAYKVRISILWVMHMVAFFAYRTIALDEGATEVSVLSNGELATVSLLLMLFAFLSLIVKSGYNRLMNLIAGVVFAVLQLAVLADGLTGYPTAAFNLMAGAAVVTMVAVVWLAAKWPKKEPADVSVPNGIDQPQ